MRWMHEIPFNLKRDGKKKTGSLDKVTKEKTSQPEKNQEKKIRKKDNIPNTCQKRPSRVYKMIDRSQVFFYIIRYGKPSPTKIGTKNL